MNNPVIKAGRGGLLHHDNLPPPPPPPPPCLFLVPIQKRISVRPAGHRLGRYANSQSRVFIPMNPPPVSPGPGIRYVWFYHCKTRGENKLNGWASGWFPWRCFTAICTVFTRVHTPTAGIQRHNGTPPSEGLSISSYGLPPWRMLSCTHIHFHIPVLMTTAPPSLFASCLLAVKGGKNTRAHPTFLLFFICHRIKSDLLTTAGARESVLARLRAWVYFRAPCLFPASSLSLEMSSSYQLHSFRHFLVMWLGPLPNKGGRLL